MPRLSPGELTATREKIAKINARATKRGLTGRLELTAEQVHVSRTDELTGLKITQVFYDVTLTGEPPSYGGYSFLARLDWDPFAGLIVSTVPGFEGTVDRDALTENWCDHCQTTRLRRAVYLVEGADGRRVQVGSTCIKDFTGWQGSFSFLSEAQAEDELFGSYGGAVSDAFETLSVLAVAWAAVKAFGFVPASSYDGMPTKEVVSTFLTGSPRASFEELAPAVRPYVESSEAEAKAVRDFVLSDDFSGQSEYVTNLKAALAGDMITFRTMGLAASAPQAYTRFQERSLVKQQEAAAAPSEWLGTVKQRLRDLQLTVKAVRYLDGDWGTTTLITFVDGDGNVAKWFASGTWEFPTDDDKRVTVTGTVKAHEEYEGRKSTLLTRCKLS